MVDRRMAARCAVAALFVVACGGGGSKGKAPEPVRSVSVSLGSAALYVGEMTQASATLLDASGNVLTGRAITWSTSSPAVASVSPYGLVTANAGGIVTISATAEGRTGTARLTATVNQPPIAAISSPAEDPVRIDKGQAISFLSSCTDPENGPVTHRWTFSGGTPATSLDATPPAVTWAAAGTYTVSYACTDPVSVSSTLASRTVVVTDPDEPSAIRIATDAPASARVREPLTNAPVVQLVNGRGADAARGGVAVTVELAGGAGTLAGTTTRVTDATGRAAFPELAFAGAAVGWRELVFKAPGLAPAMSREVLVSAGSPASMMAVSATQQRGIAGAPAEDPPAVMIQDLDANVVVGVRVDFAVTAGGGSVQGSPAFTGSDGMARVGSWTLGGSGAQAVVATAAGLAPVAFSADAHSETDAYDITLVFLTGATPSQRDAFTRAKARIERAIVGDLPAAYLPAGTSCGNATASGSVDDLLISVELLPIDGEYDVLGQAAPCWVRSASHLPLFGRMQFDTADLDRLEREGQLESVILHEMMHVVGFGTVWDLFPLVAGTGSVDPVFTGPLAHAAFDGYNGGSYYGGSPVPVENTGAAGTIDSHWRESIFGDELMTGWASGYVQPFSRTTIESLSDLGYVVDPWSADTFTISGPAALRNPGGPALDLAHDRIPDPLYEIDERGRARRVR